MHLAVCPNLKIGDGEMLEKWVGLYQLRGIGSACRVGTRHNERGVRVIRR